MRLLRVLLLAALAAAVPFAPASASYTVNDCVAVNATSPSVSIKDAGGKCALGPGSSTSGNIATWNGTGGQLLQDGGKALPSGNIVGTSDTQTLTGKTLTAPIISTISNTGTLTLPTSTDTLVGRATTDTLTNKTLTAPSIAGGTHTAITSLGIRSTGSGAFDLTIANTENLTAGRTLTVTLGDAARTLTLSGSPSLSGVTITGTGTLATTSGKTLTVSNTVTLTATDGSTLAIGGGGTLGSNAYTSTAYAPLASPTFTGTVATAALTSSGAADFFGAAASAVSNGFRVYAGGVVGWSSTGASTGGADTGFSRDSAGVIDVGNGTSGNASGTLKAAAYYAGGTAGVDCTGITAGTVTVAKGIVTHC